MLSNTSGLDNHVLSQVGILVRELCKVQCLPDPSSDIDKLSVVMANEVAISASDSSSSSKSASGSSSTTDNGSSEDMDIEYEFDDDDDDDDEDDGINHYLMNLIV